MSDQSLSAVKQQIGSQTDKPPASFENEANRAKAERIELDARSQFVALRSNWSTAILVWISVLIAHEIVLTALVGSNVLNFEKYSWFLPSVMLEHFAQVVALGVVIVKFLYHPDGTPKRS